MNFLPATSLALAEFTRNAYFVPVSEDATLDDVKRPSFWTHHAALLRVNDEITVVRADGAFDITMRVVKVDKESGAVMRVLREFAAGNANEAAVDSTPASVDQSGVPDGFLVEWAGPSARFRVVRVMDRKVLQAKFPDKPAAVEWARKNAEFA